MYNSSSLEAQIKQFDYAAAEDRVEKRLPGYKAGVDVRLTRCNVLEMAVTIVKGDTYVTLTCARTIPAHDLFDTRIVCGRGSQPLSKDSYTLVQRPRGMAWIHVSKAVGFDAQFILGQALDACGCVFIDILSRDMRNRSIL